MLSLIKNELLAIKKETLHDVVISIEFSLLPAAFVATHL